jgi:LCP family protein required for cell wall assembly
MKHFVKNEKHNIPAARQIIVFISYLLIFMTMFQAVFCQSHAFAAEDAESISSAQEQTVNLLVLGTDLPLDGTKDAGRSDSINLFSVGLDSCIIRCITFERSIPVYIPETNEKDMLTNVYHWSGAEGMVSTIEKYFDVSIDGYVQVDYETFPILVDMIGGIDLELTALEAEVMNGGWGDAYPVDVYPYEVLHEGVNSMCGHDVLEYCRLRAIDDNYMRQQRQKNAALAILKKAKTLSVSELITVINEFLPKVHTDLSVALKQILISSLPRFLSKDITFEYLQVPVKEYDSKHTMKYFSFDVQKERIRNFLQSEGS